MFSISFYNWRDWEAVLNSRSMFRMQSKRYLLYTTSTSFRDQYTQTHFSKTIGRVGVSAFKSSLHLPPSAAV